MELTKSFSPDQYSRALDPWTWLDFTGLVPKFTSLFGDVFFEATDGTWWLLEQLDGCLTQRWADGVTLAADLATEDGQDGYLLGALAMAARRHDVELRSDEVYTFVPHPMVSGDFGVDKIHTLSFVVALDVTAQLHGWLRQSRDG